MMDDGTLAQLAIALVFASTPWIVLRVSQAMARRHAASLQLPFQVPQAVRRLNRTTVAALLPVTLLAVWLPAQSAWLLVVHGVVLLWLGALALRALNQILEESRHLREVVSTKRVATLTQRRISQYLAWRWRLVPGVLTAVGLALLASRLAEPLAHRRPFVPLLFAIGTLGFLLLYEGWIRQLAVGPTVADVAAVEQRRQQWVRRVFLVEVLLVSVCLAAAHVLLDLDWSTQRAWGAMVGASASVVGVCGCALALSADLVNRRYIAAE